MNTKEQHQKCIDILDATEGLHHQIEYLSDSRRLWGKDMPQLDAKWAHEIIIKNKAVKRLLKRHRTLLHQMITKYE